jgi:hypothetical protein
MWDKSMQETINNCARAGDLVAYLYKEATEIEARNFEIHARQCNACRAELATFGDVREAIGDWRQHSLGAVASLAYEAERTHAFNEARLTTQPGRSALAAFREFFTLSPVWMRAATAFAALLFCALVVIAIAYFTEQPQVIVEKQNTSPETREMTVTPETGSDQKSNQPGVADKAQPTLQPEEVVAATNNSQPRARREKSEASASRQVAKKRGQIQPRSLNESSVELQASVDDYLPFTSSGAEDRLPSLADLANDDDN